MVRIVQPTAPQPRRRTAASNRFEAAPFQVLMDHRERAGGWRFEGLRAGSAGKFRQLLVATHEIHMVTGDYTAALPDGTRLPVVIERKSADDMLGSISGGHENLRKEHERMLALVEAGVYCCLICEASLTDLIAEMESPRWGRRASSELLLGCSASWPMRYRVPWYFCGSRALAERLAIKVMWKTWEQAVKCI